MVQIERTRKETLSQMLITERLGPSARSILQQSAQRIEAKRWELLTLAHCLARALTVLQYYRTMGTSLISCSMNPVFTYSTNNATPAIKHLVIHFTPLPMYDQMDRKKTFSGSQRVPILLLIVDFVSKLKN